MGLTWVGIVVTLAGGGSIGSIATVVRTFRVGRALRLVQGCTSMKKLFNTLLVTLPGLGNIALLLLLLLVIYSIIGVELFATVGFDGSHDEHTNFRHFFRALVVLLRFSTGENWNGFMYEIAYGPGDCVASADLADALADARAAPFLAADADPWATPGVCGYSDAGLWRFDEHAGCAPLNGCGVGIWVASFYFLTFNVFVAFIFLNLFVGVILEGFAESDEEDTIYTPDELDVFKTHWQASQRRRAGWGLGWFHTPSAQWGRMPFFVVGGVGGRR